MINKKEILKKRFEKLHRHFLALNEYKILIDELQQKFDIFDEKIFYQLMPQEKAIFDAYLKRFGAIQDFLGTKIFSLLLDISGISVNSMSEILHHIERESIIDSLDNWIELREMRNELAHDYPDELREALNILKFCVNNFLRIKDYYYNSRNFAKTHGVLE